jgi:pimeloyl-ACP methyl ester carboxylesterase
MKFAADHPDQIGKLVIVDSLPALGAAQIPNATPDQLHAFAERIRSGMEKGDAASYEANQRKFVQSMVTSDADVERIVQWGKASDRHTVVESMYDLMASDLRPELAQIKAPTLVMGTWVAYKEYAPREAIEATYQQQYAKLAGVKVEMADHARHFIMYDDPNWMFERMDAFLQ